MDTERDVYAPTCSLFASLCESGLRDKRARLVRDFQQVANVGVVNQESLMRAQANNLQVREELKTDKSGEIYAQALVKGRIVPCFRVFQRGGTMH